MAAQRRKKRGGILPVLVTMVLLVLVAVYAGGGDLEAGLEHLGRGTAANMDQFIVVVEPGARSVQTYANVKRLAADLGVRQVRVVANKVRDQRDEEFVRSVIPESDFLGCIHYNPEIMDADRLGKSPYDFCPAAIEEIRKIKAIIDRD